MDDKYGVGGNEYERKGSEGIADIPKNRTIFVEHLTVDDPIAPEFAQGLGNIEQVFGYFKPAKEIGFEDGEGQMIRETFHFSNVVDFSLDNMTQQSKFLNELDTTVKFYGDAARQLSNNKVLNRALANPDKKQNIIDVLLQCKNELKSKIKTDE